MFEQVKKSGICKTGSVLKVLNSNENLYHLIQRARIVSSIQIIYFPGGPNSSNNTKLLHIEQSNLANHVLNIAALLQNEAVA
jgi:hypothetical protein